MNPPTTAYPEKPKDAGDVRSIHVRKAENGFIASCSYDPKKTKKGSMCHAWEPDKEYVLTDRASVHKFIDDALGLEPEKPPRRFGNTI